MLQGAMYYVVFTDADQMPPPYRIDNYCEVCQTTSLFTRDFFFKRKNIRDCVEFVAVFMDDYCCFHRFSCAISVEMCLH